MPDVLTRADSLREYLTGAASDGGTQASPSASLGHYRSSTEITFLGIMITSTISGVTVDYAAGANGEGVGILTATSTTELTWKPPGGLAGVPVAFSGTQQRVVEGSGAAGKYLRVTGTPPFSVGASQITLTDLVNGFDGFDNVAAADATSGITQYRASIVVNESSFTVESVQRCIGLLGTAVVSDATQLSGSGSGTIATGASLSDWPDSGFAQVRDTGGTLKELVYYPSRTGTVLTIPAAGRGLLGTSATAGANDDVISPVPGIALAIDTAGVQAGGSSIQTIADQITAPTSVSWNLGITAATGLQIGNMLAGKAVGVWAKRQIPAGAVATPKLRNKVSNNFVSY